MKLAFRIAIGVLCFILGGMAALGVHQAFALADPDVIRIESATRYDDVAVTGDMFVLVEYTLEYASLPTENISQGWLGRLIDVSGSGQLSSVQPFAGADIPDLGYSRGVFGFYFEEEPPITGTLRVTLEGNPSLSPTPAGIFTEDITIKSASELAPDLRALAIRLEDVWAADLISPVQGGVNRYTSSGEHYFSSALPNLRALAPDLFVLQSVQIDPLDRQFDTTYTDARQNLWVGTPMATAFTSLANALNTSEAVARFIIALVLALIVAWLVGRIDGVQNMEYTVSVQIWAGYLVIMFGFWLGLVNIQTLGVMTILPALATLIPMFLQRTGA